MTDAARRPADSGPAPASACWAPSSALYFEPNGTVRACCASTLQLGRVGAGEDRRSLEDIWNGARLAAQRRALAGGDFTLGCRACAMGADPHRRSGTLAALYDDHAPGPEGPRPTFMDFALSNRCNLQCVMCDGELSSTIRKVREQRAPLPTAYDDRFFEELTPFLPGLRLATFKGGEPFLAPEAWRVWDLMAEHAPACDVSVTTNGTIWNDRVEQVIRDRQMHVAVSIDGITAATVESIRVGTSFEALWRNVDRIQAVTDEVGKGLTLNFCLMPANWHELRPFLHECDRRGVEPNVLVVDHPSSHSLLHLPASELTAIVRQLEEIELQPGAEPLGASAPAWSTALDRLRASRTSAPRAHAEPTAVAIAERGAQPSSQRRPARDLLPVRGRAALEPVLAAVHARIPGASEVEPLLVAMHDGQLVERLTEPAWSEPLDAGAWVGRAGTDLPTLLADRLGTTLDAKVAEDPDGSHLARVAFSTGDDLPFGGLTVWTTSLGGSGPDQLLAVVPAPPAPSPG